MRLFFTFNYLASSIKTSADFLTTEKEKLELRVQLCADKQ